MPFMQRLTRPRAKIWRPAGARVLPPPRRLPQRPALSTYEQELKESLRVGAREAAEKARLHPMEILKAQKTMESALAELREAREEVRRQEAEEKRLTAEGERLAQQNLAAIKRREQESKRKGERYQRELERARAFWEMEKRREEEKVSKLMGPIHFM